MNHNRTKSDVWTVATSYHNPSHIIQHNISWTTIVLHNRDWPEIYENPLSEYTIGELMVHLLKSQHKIYNLIKPLKYTLTIIMFSQVILNAYMWPGLQKSIMSVQITPCYIFMNILHSEMRMHFP